MQACRAIAALISSLAVLAANLAGAQQSPADVTFEMPLDLTRIPAEITSVKVSCRVMSDFFSRTSGSASTNYTTRIAEAVAPVSGGSVVQTIQVILPLTDQDFANNASGKQARYICSLHAYLESLQRWQSFSASQLTPPATQLQGYFVW
jgi:hypothetical protein